MRFLIIDTCTERGLIAYGNCREILFRKELPIGLTQSKFLMPYLAEELSPFGFPPPLDAVGVGIGPGSYTGIRIGVAVSQSLAYAWKLPLIGFSSLHGFIPQEEDVLFASILDARIGGFYLQKGLRHKQKIIYEEDPKVASLDEAGEYLADVSHFVTPVVATLKTKLSKYDPECRWRWEERAPCALHLLQNIETQFSQGNFVEPPHSLDLLYLRETEAERHLKEKKSGEEKEIH